MKIQSGTFYLLIAGALFLGIQTPAALSAQTAPEDRVTGRDSSVDSLLIKNSGWTGALPATRGEGAAPGSQAPFVNPAFPQPQLGSLRGIVTKDGKDHKGSIYDLKGTVKISQNGKDWKEVKVGKEIKPGDILLTAKGSSATISFDKNYRNVIHLPENSRIVFKSIEPNDIALEDGTLYNLFDGLPKDSRWKVSTPTAVASVRGTHFLVHYTSSTGEFLTATLNVPDDGRASKVEVLDIKDDGSTGKNVDVPEGNQISLKAGQEPDASLLGKVDQYWLDQIFEVLEKLAELRRGQRLPSTSGEFFEPGSLDAGGPDVVGGGPSDSLDPMETGGIASEPVAPPVNNDGGTQPAGGGGNQEPPPQGGCGNEC